MGEKTQNYFGTNGPSENIFEPGLLLDYKMLWDEDWDDGEEPPHYDGVFVTIDKFGLSDEDYDSDEQLDDDADWDDWYDSVRSDEDPDSPLLAHNRGPRDYRDLYADIVDEDEVESEEVPAQGIVFEPFLNNGIVVHPVVVPPRYSWWESKEETRCLKRHYAACNHTDLNPKDKSHMPWWRGRPQCRLSARRKPLIFVEKSSSGKVVRLAGHHMVPR